MRDSLHNIPKEKLTLENIRYDLKELYKGGIGGFIVLLLASVIFGLMSWWAFYLEDYKIGIVTGFMGSATLIFSGCAIAYLFIIIRGFLSLNKNITIVSDWLVDMLEGVQINTVGRRYNPYIELRFAKGRKYRLYTEVYGDTNYKWSKMYSMSNQGIYNYSSINDDFYLVLSNGKKPDVLLIYNKKLFDFQSD